MAAIVYQTNKNTGITYAYESISFWDKDKQQSRAKRKCIGRVDKETQKIIPSRKRKTPPVERNTKRGPAPITCAARRFYGATYLFDHIGEITGVAEDLKACFPNRYRQILSLAYYLILVVVKTCEDTSGHCTGQDTHLDSLQSGLPTPYCAMEGEQQYQIWWI